MHFNKNACGLALGLFLGLFHALWGILVVTGAAQVLLDFIYKIHFLNNPFVVAAFDIKLCLLLVVITFVVGYVIGWVLALLGNWLHKRHA